MTTIITTEEAAALMIGLDYIPPGISLRGMTAAFLEEAEVELHNAKLDRVDWRQESFLEQRVLACQHRHELVGIYLEALELELGKGEQSILAPISEGSVSSRIDLDKLTYWAANLFGISIGSPWAKSSSVPQNISPATNCEEIEETTSREGTNPPKSITSMYTTISLIIDAFLEKADSRHKINGELNVLQFSKDLEALATKYNSGMRWEGQGWESIRNRLTTISKHHPLEQLRK